MGTSRNVGRRWPFVMNDSLFNDGADVFGCFVCLYSLCLTFGGFDSSTEDILLDSLICILFDAFNGTPILEELGFKDITDDSPSFEEVVLRDDLRVNVSCSGKYSLSVLFIADNGSTRFDVLRLKENLRSKVFGSLPNVFSKDVSLSGKSSSFVGCCLEDGLRCKILNADPCITFLTFE